MQPTEPAAPEPTTRAAPRWYLRLLGGSTLDGGQGSELRRWPSRAALLLLARLALWPRRVHPREELVELLWPGVATDVGRNRLRQVLSTLRALLEPAGAPAVLQADRHALRLLPGALGCDAHDFERLLSSRRDADALALYAGELLPGVYDDWVVDERLRLQALHDRLTERQPEPPAAAAAPHPQPAPELSRPRRGALPRYLSRFFADDIALSRLRSALDATSALVLRGPGGAGKTRCAVELMRGLPPGVPVQFVDLSACSDLAALEAAVSAALADPTPTAQPLAERLAATDGWLVLDNFEQLPPAADARLSQWLQTSPLLRVLVTSRRGLTLAGALELSPPALGPLPAADAALEVLARHPAVALFVDRARAVRPDFHLTPGNAAAVRALVGALDSLPLALELAAARVRSLPPAELLTLLLADTDSASLDLVGRARSAASERQASLRDVVAWSWRLLSPPLAALAATLGSLSAPFSRGLAQALADPALGPVALAAALDELVSQSLLNSLPTAHPGEPARYLMSVPVRQFAAAQLTADERVVLRQRLRTGLLDWAETWPPTPPLSEARTRLPHLGRALDDADGEVAARWLAAWRPALQDLHLDAPTLTRLQALLPSCTRPGLLSEATAALAWQWHLAGHQAQARTQARAALSASRRAGPPARTLARWTLLALDWRTCEDGPRLRRHLARALAAVPADAASLRAQLLHIAAGVAEFHDHDAERAGQALQQALAAAEAGGNAHLQQSCRLRLATWQARRHQADEALAGLDAVARQAALLGDWEVLSSVHNSRGNLLLRLRRPADAATSLREAVRQAWAVRSGVDLAYALWNLPRALVRLPGQAPLALQLLAFAAAWWDRHYGRLTAAERRFVRRVRRLAAAKGEPALARRLWASAEGWTLDEAVARALAND
ncbi:hypothetical protein KAK07_09400 [Ideonella sp. 4Y16]|uniref:Uncharacterized protein n=1 Tax=Ideonella alba TaxID=2824118 RepID=A0A940YPC7_9BURK|nr:hypothetical protein [Ideonella alba]MBQ0933404.1 hypothetical protein [Ideonella alba]MBQ0943551.1 hypothetical protein [Ideonella alba]